MKFILVFATFLMVIVLMFGGCYLFFLPGEYDDIMRMMRDDELKEFSVLIEYPKEGDFYSNSNIQIRGRSSSIRGVKEVWLSLNNTSSFGKVSGTTEWTTNLSGLSEGIHTVYVYAVDSVGNISSTQSVSFVVDRTAPSVEILHPTNNHLTNSAIIVIRGSVGDTLSGVKEVWLRLGDSGGFGRVNGTTSWTTNLIGVSEGTNFVHVYAVDNAGNISSIQSVSFVVSMSVTVSITNLTNNQIFNTTSVSVSGTSSSFSGVKEVWLRLGNSGGFGKVSGTTEWSTNLVGLSESMHTVYVYAVDNAGNVSLTQSVSFVVSMSVTVSITNLTNNQIFNTTSVSVSGTSSSFSGVKEVWLRLGDSGGFGKVNGTTNWITNLSNLSEGTHTVYVYAVDNLGNTSPMQSVIFVVSTNVVVNITNPTSNQVFNTTDVDVSGTSFSFSGVKEVWLRLGDSGGFGRVNGTTSWTTNLIGVSEGTNFVYVYAVDNAGNVSSTRSVSFVVDRTAPGVEILHPMNNHLTNSASILISGVSSDVLSGVKEVWLSLNSTNSFGRVSGTGSWSSNLDSLSEGTNVVYVYAVDNAGNTSSMKSVSFVVDRTAPSVEILHPMNNHLTNSASILISGVSSDVLSGVKEVWLSLNSTNSFGRVSGTGSWSSNLSSLNEGTNVVYVYAVDNAGNISSMKSVSFVVDGTAPSVEILHPMNNHLTNSASILISGVSSDVLSGVKEVWLSLNSTNSFGRVSGTGSWSSNLSSLNEGTNVVYVYAVDNAGNISSIKSVSFVVVLRVYVSTNGNDANDGIYTNVPVRSIQIALNKAKSYGVNEIYITTGQYTPGSGLNTGDSGIVITNDNIRLLGGWNSSYNNIIGYSELDGNNNVKHVIFATDVTNIMLINLVIRRGNANGGSPHDRGGGIYFSNVSYSLISNLVISNNSATGTAGDGGGIYLNYSHNNTISGSVYSNRAKYGGGISLRDSYNNTISGSVYANTAEYSGGGMYLSSSHTSTISGSVYGNSAGYRGGGMYLYNSSNISILNSYITNNWTSSYNSVIHFYNGGSLTNLVISNCYIGGNNNTDAIGIYEEGHDIKGHTLRANKFITNRLRYLYSDYSGRHITNTIDWTNINNTSLLLTTPASTNNTVTNL